jgi:hypothetical protein
MENFSLVADSLGCALWRNNSGAATSASGRPVRYGLGNVSASSCRVWKSADWIGITTEGRFLAIEQKPQGWKFRATTHEFAQLAFLADVRRRGGVAGFATSADDVRKIINAGPCGSPASIRSLTDINIRERNTR